MSYIHSETISSTLLKARKDSNISVHYSLVNHRIHFVSSASKMRKYPLT